MVLMHYEGSNNVRIYGLVFGGGDAVLLSLLC